jgi:prophage antirepressor-like protein
MTTIIETLNENYILFEQYKINIIIDSNDKLWFNARDLILALGYSDSKDVMRRHINISDKIQLQHINHTLSVKLHPHSIYLSEAGLYSLVLHSRMPAAKKFTKWVTEDVLPSIRKYGYYKMKTKYESDKTGLLQHINYLEQQNKTLQSNLKKDKYPNGALVYVIDYCDEDKTLPGIYRVGLTKNLKARKELYDTHTLNNKRVIYFEESNNPVRLEKCILSMLYNYRYKDNKDFFVCSLAVIKRAFKNCVTSLKSMNDTVQSGGTQNTVIDNTIVKLQRKLSKLENNINKYSILLQ